MNLKTIQPNDEFSVQHAGMNRVFVLSLTSFHNFTSFFRHTLKGIKHGQADTLNVTMVANMSVLEVPSASMQASEIYNEHSGDTCGQLNPDSEKATQVGKEQVSGKKRNKVIGRHLGPLLNWFGALQTKVSSVELEGKV